METQEANHPVKILIVDDHPNTAVMLARVLSRFDSPVEVITASSGEDALAIIQEGPADILITDFMMPGLNGLELIEKLQGEQKPAHTILITAYDTPGLAITARRLNVQDYLVKPVQPEKIRTIVAGVIEELRPSRSPAPAEAAARTARILVADDYPDNLRLLSTRLSSEGYEFMAAWDGEETLHLLRREQPDLLLLDINMPRKDGLEVLSEMRADPSIAHIPVIIITAARIGPKDVRDGLNLGADDYVIKPFDWRELGARIRSKLRVKEAEDRLRQRARELSLLPEIGQEMNGQGDLHALTERLLRRLTQAFSTCGAHIDIFLPTGLVISKCYRPGRGELRTEEISPEAARRWGLNGMVMNSGQGVVVEDVAADERWLGAPEPDDHSAVVVPLLHRGKPTGVLTLIRTQPGWFNDEHCALLQAVASQTATGLQNAFLYDSLRLAHDELREPIMAVLGYSDMLGQAGPLTPEQAEFTHHIRSAAQQMRDVVSNLLASSHLG